MAISLGIIKKSGAWFKVGENKFQGSEKLYQFLNNNPSVVSDVQKKFNNLMSGSSQEILEEGLVE